MKTIREGVYLLESTKGAYCYLIKAEEWILVDTQFGYKKKAILKELKDNQVELRDIKHIILTHGDMDHMGNVGILQKLTGATIWAGSKEIPYIMGQKERPGFKKYIAKFMNPKKPTHIKPLKDGDKICGVEVVETPGHTPGHICLIYKDVLFTGDLVEERDHLCVPFSVKWNWDTHILFQSIRKMSPYKFKWVCVAHGEPLLRDELFDEE